MLYVSQLQQDYLGSQIVLSFISRETEISNGPQTDYSGCGMEAGM